MSNLDNLKSINVKGPWYIQEGWCVELLTLCRDGELQTESWFGTYDEMIPKAFELAELFQIPISLNGDTYFKDRSDDLR